MNLKIIPNELLVDFKHLISEDLHKKFDQLKEAEISTTNFSFYTSVASVYSSKIEGEPIDLDSYIKHKRDGISFKPDYTQKIDDLYDAYSYAQQHALNESTIKEAHSLLSKNLLPSNWQGAYRTQNMYFTTDDGKIEYVAASPRSVEAEMEKFYNDLDILIKKSMKIEEVFFYASMLHLVFVKIHPFTDGNGRTARLIEKWFLAEKLGEKAWFLSSEKMYYQNHQTYYTHLRKLGLEYELLDYSMALPFLCMLPLAL